MNTRLVMTISALFLGIIGISLTFLPNEISFYIGISSAISFKLVLQILGALLFGFAMLNWMIKEGIIGGIYNRPAVIANFTHFFIGALALIKGVFAHNGLPCIFWIPTVAYMVFALLFGLILFRNPANEKKPTI